MIGGKRVVAMIPARAGSKSIPRKNLAVVGGRSLLAHAIAHARGAPEIDRVIVSTDGGEIAAAARADGAEVYLRPAPLASDTALVIDAVRDLIARLRAEGERAAYMVLLEPTTPLREPRDIRACLAKLDGEGLDSVATFKQPDLNPHRAWRIEAGRPAPFIQGAVPWLPRQLLPEAWQLTGAVYAFAVDRLDPAAPGLLFGAAGAVIVERERSLDIDDPVDLAVIEQLFRRRAGP